MIKKKYLRISFLIHVLRVLKLVDKNGRNKLFSLLGLVILQAFFDDLISEIWPLWSAPIVGTKPIFALKLTSLFNLFMLLKIIIYGTSFN